MPPTFLPEYRPQSVVCVFAIGNCVLAGYIYICESSFFFFFFFLVGDWYGLEKSLILETGAGRSWFFGSLGGVVGEEVFNEVEFFLVLLFWGLGKVERETVLYVWKMFMIRCVKIYKCIFVLLNFPQLHKHLEEILLLEILKCNVFERNQ